MASAVKIKFPSLLNWTLPTDLLIKTEITLFQIVIDKNICIKNKHVTSELLSLLIYKYYLEVCKTITNLKNYSQ